ncbi:MAG: DUF11 domain-containing protein [Deltaproteobacteria bacterium]|nr:DUF11 domain-containing protein [Deltaproteobacteria bacterium]
MLQLNMKWIASAVLVLALVVSADVVLADGTQAGTVVLNTALVDYDVNGTGQTQESASEDFTVDRKIDLTVAVNHVAYVQTSPSSTTAILRFTVENTSNDALGFALSAVDEAAATVEPTLTGTDEVNAITFAIYEDVNGDGLLDGGDTQDYIDTLAIDATTDVIIVAEIPAAAAITFGDNLMLSALAQAAESGTLGATLVTASGADAQDVEDTEFIDASGDTVAGTDAVDDAIHSDMWAFVIQGADITVTKTATLFSGSYYIPGSVVEYTITVANGAGVEDATNVDLVDTVPANTTFVGGTLTVGGVAQSEGTSGDDFGDFNVSTAGAVSALNMTVATGTSTDVVFRVTID